MKYVLAIDQGSSGTMAALIDEYGRIVGSADVSVAGYTPQPGCVEHDPFEIVDSVKKSVRELLERCPMALSDISGVGIANQGESFLLWNADNGVPITQVISWQDGRAREYCGRLQDEDRDVWFHEKTGLRLSPEWPALKIKTLRDENPELDKLCAGGNVAYGQLDAWLLYALSGGRNYISDHSTACRSGFYNIRTLSWDEDLVSFFGASDMILPHLSDNVAHFGWLDLGIGGALPMVAGGLDQAMALAGLGLTEEGAAKVTYGTCCAFWINSGANLREDPCMTSGVAWKIGPAPVYAIAAEGSAAGNIVTWLKDGLGVHWDEKRLSQIASENDGRSGLIFLPAFSGLSAPYWDPHVKGMLFGMNAATRPEHIFRAGLEAVAFSVRDMIDSVGGCADILADGGMAANDYLMQYQADVLNHPLRRSCEREGTVTGVGRMALLGAGMIKSLDDIPAPSSELIAPKTNRECEYERWKKAVACAREFYGGHR